VSILFIVILFARTLLRNKCADNHRANVHAINHGDGWICRVIMPLQFVLLIIFLINQYFQKVVFSPVSRGKTHAQAPNCD